MFHPEAVAAPGKGGPAPRRRSLTPLARMLEPRPSNPFGPAMTSPKSLLAAASASAAQTTPVRRDERAPATRARHDRMANAIRALAMDAVEQAKSGHPGLPMGAPDVATLLFTPFLKSARPHPPCPAPA